MLGRDHAPSGALAFAALGLSLHVTGSHLAAGVLLTAGACTLPDIDHPDSTISREFGFLTQAFAWLVDRPPAATGTAPTASWASRCSPLARSPPAPTS